MMKKTNMSQDGNPLAKWQLMIQRKESVMEDKMEEILAQYPIQVTSRKRVRGAILLDTEQGQHLLRNVHGNRYRLEEEERIMEHLQSQGYQWTDQLVRTSKGELCAKDG